MFTLFGDPELSIIHPREHDLSVTLKAPKTAHLGFTHLIEATLINQGISDELDINFTLYLDDEIIETTIIPSLISGQQVTFTYNWTPFDDQQFNFTVISSPLEQELLTNNLKTRLIKKFIVNIINIY